MKTKLSGNTTLSQMVNELEQSNMKEITRIMMEEKYLIVEWD